MPNCSVIGCELKSTETQAKLTMHRLPRCEDKKKKWLEAIGMNNIRKDVEDIYICSQHFNENAFKTILGVERLRDDALPSKPLQRNIKQDNSSILETLLMKPSNPCPIAVELDRPSNYLQEKNSRRIRKLEQTCEEQRKKIKILNQIIYRQNKKIVDFRNIIKDLLESNLLDSEECENVKVKPMC